MHSSDAAAASLRQELSAVMLEKAGLQAALASSAADGRASARGSESEIASLVASREVAAEAHEGALAALAAAQDAAGNISPKLASQKPALKVLHGNATAFYTTSLSQQLLRSQCMHVLAGGKVRTEVGAC